MFRFTANFLAVLICLLANAVAGEANQPQESTPHNPPPKEQSVSHDPAKPHKFTNALAKETSPYLLQHAHNPVNWFPWGPEAFAKAKAEDKPVFLSVGYSSCHWCHVMERESFENEAVAALVNANFVAIKVDREERPDIDEIYMTAVQLVTQRGGWPMTVFLTPDAQPFFAGTYFPPEDYMGRMGFKSLLQRVALVWKNQRADVLRDAERLSDGVREQMSNRRIIADGPLDRSLLENCIDRLNENFDPVQGGFSDRPKFPPNNGLPLLLYMIEQNPEGDPRIKQMAALTLDKMALGGIHDHLAGGFHRYSTDERWLLPHFEKMLYDNALLSRSYAQASVVLKNPEYARVARGVYDWVLREMTSPEGGFYSTLDADSEGHEGKFYVWSRAEVDQVLGADSALFCEIYGIAKDGNFHEEATGEDTGLNIPHLAEPLSATAGRRGMSEADLRAKMDADKARLLAVRIKRVWPALDDKILTSWNALMMGSFARASEWLNEPRYKDAALRCAEFLLKNQRTADGRWLATHRKGESKLPAYLDDHAFLACGFMDLYTVTKDARWLQEARAVAKLMDTHFTGADGGGYFFTADDHEALLTRSKDPVDKAIPSGNGMAAQALVRLSVATGERAYAERAEALFEEFQGLMERIPHATESLLLAVGEYLDEESARGPAAPESIRDVQRIVAGAVTVEGFTGTSALRRGDSVPVAVRFTIENGWHVAAALVGDAKQEVNVAPARISLASGGFGKFGPVNYPKAEMLKSPELGGELPVYVGTVVAGGLLTVRADAPLGKRALKLRVYAQACNDRACQAPLEAVLSIPVEIVEKGAAVTPQHDEVMRELKLE
jgi:uncharacterized protein